MKAKKDLYDKSFKGQKVRTKYSKHIKGREDREYGSFSFFHRELQFSDSVSPDSVKTDAYKLSGNQVLMHKIISYLHAFSPFSTYI